MTDTDSRPAPENRPLVLIVGGSSKVALALALRLERDYDVLTAGRQSCDVEIDLLSEPGEIRVPDGVDVVVNCAAAFPQGDQSEESESVEVNVRGPQKLYAACKAAGSAQLIQLSSIFAGLPSQDPSFTTYAMQKRRADEALTAVAAESSGPVCTILRPTQIYGPGEFHRTHQPFLYSIVGDAAAGNEIVLAGNHDALRDYLHIDDFAEIVARVIELRLPGTFDCPGPEPLRYSQIAETAAAAFGGRSKVVFDHDGPNTLDNVGTVDRSLYPLIGFEPKISFADGMAIEARLRAEGA